MTPNVTVGVGQKIDIRVGVTNVKESGPFKAVWSHNGQLLEESGRVQIGTESSWLNVSISNAMTSDKGIYLLHVSDNVSSSQYKVVEVFVIGETLSTEVVTLSRGVAWHGWGARLGFGPIICRRGLKISGL